MQEGMRIKSKDIHFAISIFYLAINLSFDIFKLFKNYIFQKFFWSFIYLP